MVTPVNRADVSAPLPTGDSSPVGVQRTDLEMLYRQRYGEFVGLASLITCRGHSSPEDIVQDAFAAVYARESPLERPHELAGYVTRAVVNRSRSEIRSWRRHGTAAPLPSDLAVIAKTENSEDRMMVMDALGRLPRRQRESAVCHLLLGLTHQEAADVLGVRIGTVKTHLKRASRSLASNLEDDHESYR